MLRVLISVTSDLVTDQRVHRVSSALAKKGYSVLLVGRKKKTSPPIPPRDYNIHRLRLFFEKGPLFYAEYNIRLFLYLLFHRADVLLANDLDTLPANYFASVWKGSKLVFDSHEYFTEVPELQERPFTKKVWKVMERFIFPKLKHVYTVNESIAGIYEHEYKVKVHIIRNVPVLTDFFESRSRNELNLPEHKAILLCQGTGINIHRGAEEAVEAMQYLDNAVLLIIGDGDVLPVLKQMTTRLHLEEKVLFIPRLPFEQLRQYTVHADIGLTLDKDISLNYRYSLPNKLFDYIHAGVPVLASPLPEVKKIVEGYGVGMLIDDHDPKHIAEKIQFMLEDEKRRGVWKENLLKAKKQLCWQNEEKVLFPIFEAD